MRLSHQLVVHSAFNKPGDVVHWLGAVQAQDYPAALWGIGMRTRGATARSIEQAIAEKKIVRTWPMRGTLHFVSPQDVRWMLAHLTARKVAGAASRFRNLRLDGATFMRSEKILYKALEGKHRLTRDALYTLLERNHISCAGQRGIHILWRLAQEQLICFGPREGNQHTFVLFDEWIPPTSLLSRDEALNELALRFFNSHGPATIKDFAWWSGLSLREAKASIKSAASDLDNVTIDDEQYWMPRKQAVASSNGNEAHFLPAFDEYLVSYKDRSFAVKPRYAKRMHPGGGILNPTIVCDGRIVGTWKRSIHNHTVEVHIHPFGRMGKTERSCIEQASERYGMFLGKEIVLRINR